MKTYRQRLARLAAATFLALPVYAGSLHAEDSIELLTGSIRASRLVAPSASRSPVPAADAGDAATALSQPLPPSAQAQPAGAAPAVVEPDAAKAAKPVPDTVELAALYYYADQKQEARVNAEVDRLRLKYPDFEVPDDLYANRTLRQVDETPLWSLYEKDDFAGIDALVAKMQAAHAGWQPSADFSTKLKRRKLRVTLTNAYKGKDWIGVISAASAINPVAEKDADILWMLIDAYREADMQDALLEVYKGLLFRQGTDRLPDPVLVTTLQKATRDFQPDEIRAAMTALWQNPSLIAALKPINDDFLRRDIADFNTRSERQQPLDDKDIQRMRTLVAAGNDTADMSLLGWYFLKLKQPKEAEPFFTRALALKQTPEFAKGLYLSLAQQNRDADAYALAAAHLKELTDDPQFLMNALSLRFSKPELGPIDPKSVEAYSSTILQTKSADHAEILAWYAYNSLQFQASEAWFVQAWNWEEEPNRLKGIALSFMREGKKKQFAALRARFGDLYPDMWAEITNTRPPVPKGLQVVAINQPQTGPAPILYRQPQVITTAEGARQVVYQVAPAAPAAPVAEAQAVSYVVQPQQPAPVAPQLVYASAPVVEDQQSYSDPAPVTRVVKVEKGARASGYLAAFKARRFSACVDQLNALAASGPLSADAQLIRGWCYLGLNRASDAKAAFDAALAGRGQVRHDAAYGSALAALRVKLTDEAEAVISAYPLSADKDREVRAEIYWQRARSAFDHHDFQATLDALNARMKLVPESSDLSQLRAWAHYKLGHRTEARAIFTKLNDQLADTSAMQGLFATQESLSR